MKKYRKKRYRNEIRVNNNRKRIVSLTMVWVLCLMLLPTVQFLLDTAAFHAAYMAALGRIRSFRERCILT